MSPCDTLKDENDAATARHSDRGLRFFPTRRNSKKRGPQTRRSSLQAPEKTVSNVSSVSPRAAHSAMLKRRWNTRCGATAGRPCGWKRTNDVLETQGVGKITCDSRFGFQATDEAARRAVSLGGGGKESQCKW